jgi:hypothetical protein
MPGYDEDECPRRLAKLAPPSDPDEPSSWLSNWMSLLPDECQLASLYMAGTHVRYIARPRAMAEKLFSGVCRVLWHRRQLSVSKPFLAALPRHPLPRPPFFCHRWLAQGLPWASLNFRRRPSYAASSRCADAVEKGFDERKPGECLCGSLRRPESWSHLKMQRQGGGLGAKT